MKGKLGASSTGYITYEVEGYSYFLKFLRINNEIVRKSTEKVIRNKCRQRKY